MLPGWFGFGSAAAKIGADKSAPDLQRPRLSSAPPSPIWKWCWPNPPWRIARRYAELVEDRALAKTVTARIEEEWQATVAAVLGDQRPEKPIGERSAPGASIQSRLPYVNALNHLQVDLLRRRRAGDAEPRYPSRHSYVDQWRLGGPAQQRLKHQLSGRCHIRPLKLPFSVEGGDPFVPHL